MRLFRTIRQMVWRRTFWAGLFFLMLAINSALLLSSVSASRNELIFNPIVKAGLPFYRVSREAANSIIDSLYVFAMRRDVGIPSTAWKSRPAIYANSMMR